MTEAPYWLALILAVFWLPLVAKWLLRFSIKLLATVVCLGSIIGIAVFVGGALEQEWAETVLLTVGLK